MVGFDDFGERLTLFIEAMQPMIDAYCEVMREIAEVIDRWVTIRRRGTMYLRLRQKHVPRFVANWLVWHVPRWCLPWPSFVEWLVMMY